MKHGNSLTTAVCAALAAAAFSAAIAVSAAETKDPVTDDLGVLMIPKGAPLQISAYWVMSGADSALGIDEKRGVEIAIKDRGGTLVGHPIKLNVEDDGCNAEGGQTAATKLAANPNTAIVLDLPARARRLPARRFFGGLALPTSTRRPRRRS
jgi:branched-chain amino acid transport system substrate-binding protein